MTRRSGQIPIYGPLKFTYFLAIKQNNEESIRSFLAGRRSSLGRGRKFGVSSITPLQQVPDWDQIDAATIQDVGSKFRLRGLRLRTGFTDRVGTHPRYLSSQSPFCRNHDHFIDT
jgi:hypothetical protein